MKPLLIHNDNTYLLKNFHDNSWFSEKFIPTAKTDIDVQLTTFINNRIADKNISAIFIKSTLSVNYLEFLGLRLGIHIRLSNKLPNIQNLPIVFLGEETLEEICKIYAYPEIFYSSGTFISPENFTCIQVFFDLIANNSLECCTNIDLLIKKLNIDPPANYLSHHSIANEWSILRWAKVLGISAEREALKEVRSNIESLLYYKYLQAKYPIETEPDKAAFKINGKGSILYIDDEWNKGWNEVLSNYFATSSTEIEFETLKYDFKDKSHQDILKACDRKIQSFKPDVVLLDLRLSDSDFSNSQNSKHLTGYKVLQAIKSFNPGIQVIIFTASNKVWNLLELQANGADGFLLKESPELTVNSSYTYESLSSLNKQIKYCLSNAYLKEIWNLFQEIKKVFSKNPLTIKYFPKYLKEQINGIKYQNLLLQELDAIFEILKTNNENRYSMAMIMLYKVLEYLNEIFYQKVAWDMPPLFYDNSTVDYFDKNSNSWKKSTDRLDHYNKQKRATEQIRIKPEWLKSTSNKILNLAFKKLCVTDKDILTDLISLSDYRNDFIHSDSSKRNSLRVLESKDILKWSNSITTMIKHL
jgi:CheY-like chemotaxis protein